MSLLNATEAGIAIFNSTRRAENNSDVNSVSTILLNRIHVIAIIIIYCVISIVGHAEKRKRSN